MPAFFLTLIACAVVTVAGREQVRVARLSASLGSGTGLFVAIWLGAILSSAIVAWLGTEIAPMMPAAGKQMFVALALAFSAAEVAILRAGRKPEEPTRSTGAIFLVLFSAQLTDAARFLVLALSVATAQPVLAAAGGALGSGLALSAAALAGADWEEKLPVRRLAWGVGGVLFAVAIVIGLSARGLFG